MSSAAFQKAWLDTDTWIGKLEPAQVQRLRALCEKFYEAGRKMSPSGDEIVKIIAFHRVAELRRLDSELNTVKWAGADAGWDQAIEATRAYLLETCAAILATNFAAEASAMDGAQVAIEKAMGK
ncbi:MAG: hypothetical protein B7Z31_00180 [Rhodobacterales bacterium 12-65-15]|nr:MAG: hypothetical protein B7Z31_00180 [Rhodobacterales bacterium 12-65-15]